MLDTFIDAGGQLRPTRRRLLVTTAVSTYFVAAVLTLLGALANRIRGLSDIDKIDPERLTVVVRDDAPQPARDRVADELVVPSPAKEEGTAPDDPSGRQDSVVDDTRLPIPDAESVIDWNALAEAAVETSVDVYFSERESQMDM